MPATPDATACNAVQKLKGKQARAVDLLAGGCSDREVAEAVSCDSSTVWRWRTRDPAFRAALNARRQELWATSLDRLRSLVPRALVVVEEALDAGDSRAALALLRLAGLGDVFLGSIGPVDADVIAEADERERVRREQELADAEYRAAEAEIRAAEQKSGLELRRLMAGMA